LNNNSLIKNSFYNVVYKVLNVVFPLLTATYTARIIFADGVGEVSYAQNIVSYFTTIAALGIPNYGIREVAKVKHDVKKSNVLFNELLVINTISTTICIILYYILINIVIAFKSNIKMYYAVGLLLVFNYINIDWFYQGKEEYVYIAKRSFVIKLISLIAMFIFVRTPNDTIKYALITCFALGGNNVLNILNLRKYQIKINIKNINVLQHLKPIFILLASVISIELYTMLDVTMIGMYCDSSAVAYYTNSMKLVKMLITVITAIGAVLLPRMSQYYTEGNIKQCEFVVNKVFRLMLFLFIPCEIGIILSSELIMPIMFGETFIPAIGTLKITGLLICSLGFSNLFGTQILLTFGQEKKLLYCTLAGAFSNIIMNSFLIPRFQQNGAAIASVISESLVTILAYLFSSKYIRIYLKKNFVISLTVSSIFMFVFIKLLMQISISFVYVKLSIIILSGCIIYFGFNLLMRNSELYELFDILKKKR